MKNCKKIFSIILFSFLLISFSSHATLHAAPHINDIISARSRTLYSSYVDISTELPSRNYENLIQHWKRTVYQQILDTQQEYGTRAAAELFKDLSYKVHNQQFPSVRILHYDDFSMHFSLGSIIGIFYDGPRFSFLKI